MDLTLGQLKLLWGSPKCLKSPDLSIPLGPICTDSRKVKIGDFFVALKGSKFDGHDFLEEVHSLGIQAAVLSKNFKKPIPKGLLHWKVNDTLTAYQELGLLHRQNLNIPVIAVTGSAGKTTTRELIKACLNPLGKIMSSAMNENNDIGVPLTLTKTTSDYSAIVVEMGMRGKGEIKRLSCYSHPDIAVITNIGHAHLGRLGSRANIAQAKCEITSCLNPNGLVVIPFGDELLEKTLKESWKGRITIVRLDENEKVEEGYVNKNPPSQNKISYLFGKINNESTAINYKNNLFELPLDGKHNAMNLMLAIAVAEEMNVPLDKLGKMSVNLPSGRHQYLNIAGCTVMNETYNSSPETVDAALNLLASKPGRHFAVLGKMLELGSESLNLHKRIVETAIRLGINGLVVVADGEEAEIMAQTAESLDLFEIVNTPEEAISPLSAWLKGGDYLLLKASRGIKLERLIPLLEELKDV